MRPNKSMANDFTQMSGEELYEMFRKLPPDVRDAYNSIEYEKVLEDIAKKHALHLDQADALGNETFQLMLGMTHPTEFIGKIASRANIPQAAAKEIAEEVNERVFKPIRGSLMKIHKMMEESGEDEEENAEDEGESGEHGTAEAVSEKSPANVAQEKLQSSFSIPKKSSSYSNEDPYREKI